jgi:tetratricopeptide (TPR) repeat protein
MKKILILLTMVMAFGLVNAQKAKRTSAYNYWNDGKLDKAKEYIDPTINDPATMSDAKTWLYRGNIYLDIHRSAKPEYKALAPDALQIAYDSYKKATELDVKKEYQAQLMVSMLSISEQLYNSGATLFQASEFSKAAADFEKAISVSQSMNNIDTMAIYGAALSYEGAKDFAKSASFYEQLVNLKVDNPLIYSSLCTNYSELKQTDKAEAILEQGRKLYPNDFNLIIAQSNLYLQQNNPPKALSSLTLAREKDPNNKSIIFAIGVTYDMLRSDTTKTAQERQVSFDKAVESYKDAIALDSTYFDAIFNLGALYFNKGGDIINEANKLPLGDKTYDILVAQGNDHLRMSLPYLEKASRMHPEDTNALVSLKEIYTRLQMFDKQKEVNARLQGK